MGPSSAIHSPRLPASNPCLSWCTHLDLSETGLTEFPASVVTHPGLDTLMLINNLITELPAGLFDSVVYDKSGITCRTIRSLTAFDNSSSCITRNPSYRSGRLCPRGRYRACQGALPEHGSRAGQRLRLRIARDPGRGPIELTRLETELAQLSSDLAAWTADLPPLHPRTGEPFNERQLFVEHANRDEFMQQGSNAGSIRPMWTISMIHSNQR